MLGVMMRLNGCMFYMCPCCTGIRIWAADGSDFDRHECPCWRYGGSRSAVISAYNRRTADSIGLSYSSTYLCTSPVQADDSTLCLVCFSKNVCPRARMVLPEVERRCMRRVNFCRKHAPPDHVLGTVTSFGELKEVLARHQETHPTARFRAPVRAAAAAASLR